MTLPTLRTVLPAAALLLAVPFATAPRDAELQAADVRDLVAWEWCVAPGSTLVDAVRTRVRDVSELRLRGGLLAWSSDAATADRVHRALDALRDEAGTRAHAGAAESARSLLRDRGDEDFARVQLAITWVGEQQKPVPGLAVHSTSRLFDGAAFRAFRRAGIHYGNDDLPAFATFAARPAELRALVRAVLASDADVAAAAMRRMTASAWSLRIVDVAGPRRPSLVELLLDADEGRALFGRMAAAMPAGSVGREVLEAMQSRS